MGNPNSITSNSSLDKLADFVGNGSEKNNDIKAINQERGKSTLKGTERAKRIEELNKEIAEVKAKLLANGVDPKKIEEIEKRARADEHAINSQKPVEPEPKPEPEPELESDTEPAPVEPEYEPTDDAYDDELYDDEDNSINFPEVAPSVVAQKSPKNKGMRRAITAAIIGVATILGTTALGGLLLNRNKKAMAKNPTATEAVATDDGVIVIPVDSEDIPDQETIEEAETVGIKEGYGEEGMWCADSKPNSVAFADFKSVISKFGGNVKAAAKYTCDNEVEAKSDYIAGLDAMRPAAFKGLSELEINDKLEHLSPEEFNKISQEFNSILDKADNVKEISLNGKYSNAYMAIKDGGNLVGSKIAKDKNLAINHETMQLIQCTTNEKGAKAYQLEWHDENGKLIDSIIIKEACAQVVEKEGSNPARFKGLPEVTEVSVQAEAPVVVNTPTVNITTTVEQKKEEKKVEKKKTTHKDQDKKKDKETPPTPPTPPPDIPPVVPPTPPPDVPPIVPPKDHEQKDEDKERENAGDNVDQRDIDNNVTPPTTKEEDQRNADEIEKQRQAEEAARQEAERVAEEQRQAEEAARREAENREVADESNEEETRDADQDKERAEDEASREQEEAAKEERENREEQERREEAQEEANEKAEENEQEAESHADDTASERADAFNNGDF
ncbi:hypothetical protein IJG27_01555 [Candidatus Saccharibacteria bacterium]|nr:hypothetical protein [Candidatus Saccharibacteria bacterium]